MISEIKYDFCKEISKKKFSVIFLQMPILIWLWSISEFQFFVRLSQFGWKGPLFEKKKFCILLDYGPNILCYLNSNRLSLSTFANNFFQFFNFFYSHFYSKTVFRKAFSTMIVKYAQYLFKIQIFLSYHAEKKDDTNSKKKIILVNFLVKLSLLTIKWSNVVFKFSFSTHLVFLFYSEKEVADEPKFHY